MRLIDRISGRIEKVIYPKKARNVRLTRPVYKDRHSGRNFLIIALGPNTAKYKEEIFDFVRNDNFVTVGVNNCFDLDINFDYHAITSRHRFADYGKRLNETSSTPMIAPYIQKRAVRKILNKERINRLEYIMYKSDNEVKFDITEDGIILGTCKSVAILMIAVAIVMGGRMIYVAGMDGYSKIIENGSSSIHYNKSRPKYNFNKEKKEFLRHYTTVEKYQKRFLREIREYQILHNKEPFKIITPTVFEEHYDPKVLRIR